MIYEKDNVYYLRSGNGYEVANIEIKYSRVKKKNIIVVTGSGSYVSNIEEPIKEYTFKELEKELIK